MRVFKACLLVIKRRMVTFATYFAIFIGLSILLSQFSKESFNSGFEENRPEFTVINRDGKNDGFSEGTRNLCAPGG